MRSRDEIRCRVMEFIGGEINQVIDNLKDDDWLIEEVEGDPDDYDFALSELKRWRDFLYGSD